MGCFTSVLANSTIKDTGKQKPNTNVNAKQHHYATRTSIMSDMTIFSISDRCRRESVIIHKPNPSMLLSGMTQIAQSITPGHNSSDVLLGGSISPSSTANNTQVNKEIQLIADNCSNINTQPDIYSMNCHFTSKQKDCNSTNESNNSTTSFPLSDSISSFYRTKLDSKSDLKITSNHPFEYPSASCQHAFDYRRNSEQIHSRNVSINRPVRTAPNIHLALDRQTKTSNSISKHKHSSKSRKSSKSHRSKKSKTSKIDSVEVSKERHTGKRNSKHRNSKKRNDSTSTKRTTLSKQSVTSSLTNWFDSLLRHNSFLQSKSIFGDSSATGNTTTPPFLIQEINEHQNGVNCLELSEDHSLLVSGGEDGILRLWSTFSTPCECIGILVGHRDYITCCTIYQYLVISGSADHTLKVWRIEDGNCLATLTGHTAFINRCVCYGPLLLSSSFDNTVRIWSLKEKLTIVHHAKSDSISKENYSLKDDSSVKDDSQSNRSIPITSNITFRKHLKTYFGACLYVLEGHSKSVTQVVIVSSDNSSDQLENGIIQELDIVVTTSTDSTARTYNLATGELRHVLQDHQGPINCLAVDPKDNQFVYTGGADSVIKCWDVITGEHLRDLKGHQNTILCLLTHKSILYSGSADNTVRAWAMEFGQCTRIYYRNTSSVTCIQYFKGILYTGSNDNDIRTYDSNSAVLKQTFSGHTNSISALRVVPGKLFSASFDSRILVWDTSESYVNTELPTSHSTTKMSHGAHKKLSLTNTKQNDKITKQRAHNETNHRTNTRSNVNSISHKSNINKIYPQPKRVISNWYADNQLSTQLHMLYEQINTNKRKSKMSNCCAISLKSAWHRCLSRKTVHQNRQKMNAKNQTQATFESSSEEDSGNVRKAIDALEPYIRSFR